VHLRALVDHYPSPTPSSLFELSTTTPESMEENSSTDSMTSEEIDTRQDPEEIATTEMQRQINRLRVLDLHLPNTVHRQ
jgi:hypothetical protein